MRSQGTPPKHRYQGPKRTTAAGGMDRTVWRSPVRVGGKGRVKWTNQKEKGDVMRFAVSVTFPFRDRQSRTGPRRAADAVSKPSTTRRRGSALWGFRRLTRFDRRSAAAPSLRPRLQPGSLAGRLLESRPTTRSFP